MKRQIAFLVSAMMTVNLFTAVPAFATDDFSDAEVVVEEDSNEDAEEMEIQDSTEEDFEDEGAVTEDSAASESEQCDRCGSVFRRGFRRCSCRIQTVKRCTDCRSKTGVRLWERLSETSFF